MRLEEMTSADVARLRRKPVVLLPVGAVEQHGPHLPPGADITALSDSESVCGWECAGGGGGPGGKTEPPRPLAARPPLPRGRGPAGRTRTPRPAVVGDARRYWPGVTGDPRKASRSLGER